MRLNRHKGSRQGSYDSDGERGLDAFSNSNELCPCLNHITMYTQSVNPSSPQVIAQGRYDIWFVILSNVMQLNRGFEGAGGSRVGYGISVDGGAIFGLNLI